MELSGIGIDKMELTPCLGIIHLKQVLPSIISHDQTAYLKGRYTGENIRTVAYVVEYCKSRNMTSVLLLIDFENAFDTVKWEFLNRILKKFNFGNVS